MITFKQFLAEGGHATAKYETERATADDIKVALQFVSRALGVPYETLKNDLLGSTALTLMGKKKDSGDIDLAFSLEDTNTTIIDKKMQEATGGEGAYNPGTKVGSYAVPVGGGKKVQVDLMFVKNKDWAKWMYHSSEGNGSKYPGAVRNILLFTALAHTQEPDKDFVLRDDDGRPVIRASKSVKMDSGMERLFKMARFNEKTGKYNKGLDKVEPEVIEAHLKALGRQIKFSHDPDITDNPDHVAEHVFGKGTKAKDLMSAESVIKQIHKMPNSHEVIEAGKSELKRIGLPIPTEL